jgi:hypothetical protein
MLGTVSGDFMHNRLRLCTHWWASRHATRVTGPFSAAFRPNYSGGFAPQVGHSLAIWVCP